MSGLPVVVVMFAAKKLHAELGALLYCKREGKSLIWKAWMWTVGTRQGLKYISVSILY
jgi:hypothetical protein